MITFHMLGKTGRLGNQMFQYAATKSAAINCNSLFAIPIENHELSNWFNIDCKFYSLEQNLSLINKLKYYNEAIFHYDSRFQTITDNTTLFGYFQSDKYFEKYEHIIRKDFTFKDQILDNVATFMKDLSGQKEIVSVHIRRGDYVNLQQFHPLCSEKYYNEAMNIMGDCKFLIFSDDIQWCKNTFGNSRDIIYSDLPSHISDLCAMTMCDHNIIANSSFSWWGAWLNNNKNKKVVAPARWFGESYSDKNTKDIYCESWIKI